MVLFACWSVTMDFPTTAGTSGQVFQCTDSSSHASHSLPSREEVQALEARLRRLELAFQHQSSQLSQEQTRTQTQKHEEADQDVQSSNAVSVSQPPNTVSVSQPPNTVSVDNVSMTSVAPEEDDAKYPHLFDAKSTLELHTHMHSPSATDDASTTTHPQQDKDKDKDKDKTQLETMRFTIEKLETALHRKEEKMIEVQDQNTRLQEVIKQHKEEAQVLSNNHDILASEAVILRQRHAQDVAAYRALEQRMFICQDTATILVKKNSSIKLENKDLKTQVNQLTDDNHELKITIQMWCIHRRYYSADPIDNQELIDDVQKRFYSPMYPRSDSRVM